MKTIHKAARSDRLRGITFPEIVVAVAVFAIMVIPLYLTMGNVQTDTKKSINYLRAIELANEAIDYVKMLPVDKDFKRNADALSGSILIETGSDFEAAQIPTGANDYYKDVLEPKIQYSSQYNPAYFYRTIEVSDLTGTGYAGLLKKVIVTVYWDNDVKVNNIHDLSKKTRNVVMATLVTDWKSQP
ncbi:MAG: hypothetical protein GQF41_0806 [Candidatus Rifleibacterium amylolyticum]|nr:MAG: hypothetical protein GQF41_0806 [Candidatus Rifleibacterium amylolyticum]NLF97902.1 hypothetical protein [Candidatus Riflebacteria bacterium]